MLGIVAAQLNRAIAESSAARAELERLAEKRLAVEVQGLGLGITLSVAAGRLELGSDTAAPADARLEAAPLDLLRLLGPDSLRRLKSTAVVLSGDVHVAESYATLLRCLEPDIEDALSGFVGDVAAHAVGRRLRGLRRWSSRASEALALDTAEYLQEESRVLPGPGRVRAFCGAVDRLRDDVERAAQRIERLERTRAARL